MLTDIVALVVVFFLGAIVGAKSPVSVESAINRIKAAETKAKSVLDQITTHKAN